MGKYWAGLHWCSLICFSRLLLSLIIALFHCCCFLSVFGNRLKGGNCGHAKMVYYETRLCGKILRRPHSTAQSLFCCRGSYSIMRVASRVPSCTVITGDVSWRRSAALHTGRYLCWAWVIEKIFLWPKYICSFYSFQDIEMIPWSKLGRHLCVKQK